jgi:acyl-CoA thioesterase-1
MPVAVVASVLASLLFSRPPVVVGPPSPPLTYVVLGDSTAAGEGASYESGIAMRTTSTLAQRFHVTMFNLSVSGARISDVRRDQLAEAESLHPDLVLLSVGANDVTHLTPIGRMRSDLREIVRKLRASNHDVKIVVTGSPDMGAPPRVPWLLRGLASHRTKRVNAMFEPEAAAMRLTFAPIALRTGPLFRADHTLFAADNFHPNERGYAAWIAVLDEALGSALR